MKTEFANSSKDNVATTTFLTASLFAVLMGAFSGSNAVANEAAAVEVQKIDAIVVTASHRPDVKLDAIVVTATRLNSRA